MSCCGAWAHELNGLKVLDLLFRLNKFMNMGWNTCTNCVTTSYNVAIVHVNLTTAYDR